MLVYSISYGSNKVWPIHKWHLSDVVSSDEKGARSAFRFSPIMPLARLRCFRSLVIEMLKALNHLKTSIITRYLFVFVVIIIIIINFFIYIVHFILFSFNLRSILNLAQGMARSAFIARE